jgi:hemoglobin
LSQDTFYEKVGGQKTFSQLISHFYALVAVDPILRPMYPESDLKAAALRLQMFLEQYWGGPTTYSEQRGHPRLRMRHAPFHISRVEHDSWINCMQQAVADLKIDQDLKDQLWSYLTQAASAMINAAE